MTKNENNQPDEQVAKATKEAWQPRLGPRPWVAVSLIGINLAIYVYTAYLSGAASGIELEVLIECGARQGVLVYQGAWWRLITAMFLHANLPHLLINLYSLYVLGLYLEPQLGAQRFLLLYLLAGLAGNLLSQLTMNPLALSIGASGAIFGLAGGILSFQALVSGGLGQLLRRPQGFNLIIIIMINLLLGFSIPGIDNAAHVGGLFCGVGLGHWHFAGLLERSPALDKDQQRSIGRKRRWVLAITLSMLSICALNVPLAGYFNRLMVVEPYLAEGRYAEALAILEEYAEALDDDPVALYQLGALSREMGKMRQAEEAFTRCLAALDEGKSPKTGSMEEQLAHVAPFNLALVHLYLGERDAAQRVLSETDPRGIGERRSAAQLWQLLGRADRAEAVLRGYFAERGTRSLRIYEGLLELYLKPLTHDREQALQVSVEIQKDFPNTPRAVYLEGRVHEAFVDYRRALELYLAVESELASDWEWWHHVGLCYLRLGEIEQALPRLLNARNRILSVAGNADMEMLGARFTIEVYVNQALRLAGRTAEAEKMQDAYLKALHEDANNNRTLNNLNQLAYFIASTVVTNDAGNLSTREDSLLDEALTAARASVELFAGGDNLDTLAWVFFQRGEYREAREFQQLALERAIVRTPELVFHLAAINQALGENDRANLLYRELLDLGLDFDGREELFSRMRALR